VRAFRYRVIKLLLPNIITASGVLLCVKLISTSDLDKVKSGTLSYDDLAEEMATNAVPHESLQMRGKKGNYSFHQTNSSMPYTGLSSQFHTNGQLESLFYIKNGKILSAKGWTEHGQTSTTHIENGTGFIMELNDMMVGFVYDKGQMIAYRGRKPNGKLFRESLVDGAHHVYDQHGQIREQGQYKNGYKDGIWKNWNHDGVLVRQISYDEGALDGICREWHDNGKLKLHFLAKAGEPHSLWSEYNEKGKLTAIKHFSHGKADGTWKTFYDDGTLKFEGSFKNDESEGAHRWWNQNGELQKSHIYTKGKRVI